MKTIEVAGPDHVEVVDGSEHLYCDSKAFLINSYKFEGFPDIEVLEEAFYAVVDNVARLNYQLKHVDDNKWEWQETDHYNDRFLVMKSSDIDRELEDLSEAAAIMSLSVDSNHSPMILAVIQSICDSGKDEFYITQICSHLYLDGRSAEYLFNLIVDYYNALSCGDTLRPEEIIRSAKQLRTISSDSVLSDLLDTVSPTIHHGNIRELSSLETCDVGEYTIRQDLMPTDLNVCPSVFRRFELANIVRSCRDEYPHLTRNSIILATLVKAFYNHNITDRHKAENHKISFFMFTDLLLPELRKQYCGNYVSGFPVTVEGNRDLEDIANDIGAIITAYKASKMDWSISALGPSAKRCNTLTKQQVKDATEFQNNLSFMVSNWTNFRFDSDSNFLNNCRTLEHRNALRMEPDGRALTQINHLVLIVSIGPRNSLCVSMMYALKNELYTIADSIEAFVADANSVRSSWF